MKKSLLAVVIAALPAVAFAQSSGSNVTMYGVANIGLTKITGTGLKLTDAPDGSSSRWGVRGSEDLGGGLRANFTLEAQADLANGGNSANFFQRQAWAGLSGGFGEVRFGRQYTVGFGGSIWSMPSTAVNSQLAAGLGFNGTGARSNSQIRYISPNFGGATFHASHVLKDDNAGNNITELGLLYGAGPIAANVTMTKVAGSSASFGLNGAYNFGAFKALGGYIRVGAPTSAGESKGLFLGAEGSFGAVRPWVQIARNTTTKVSALEFGGRYDLSKRTNVYAVFGRVDNPSPLTDPTRIGVGIQHSF